MSLLLSFPELSGFCAWAVAQAQHLPNASGTWASIPRNTKTKENPDSYLDMVAHTCHPSTRGGSSRTRSIVTPDHTGAWASLGYRRLSKENKQGPSTEPFFLTPQYIPHPAHTQVGRLFCVCVCVPVASTSTLPLWGVLGRKGGERLNKAPTLKVISARHRVHLM